MSENIKNKILSFNKKLINKIQEYTNSNKKRLSLVLIVSILFTTLISTSYTNAQSIYVDGEYIGTIKKTNINSKNLKKNLEKEISNELYTDVEINQQVSVTPVKADKNDIEPQQEVFDKAKQKAEYNVNAGVIVVDGQKVMSLASYDRAEKAINTVMNKYIDYDMDIVSKGFGQRVEIISEYVPLSETTSYDKAIPALEKLLTVEIKENVIYNEIIPVNTIVTETDKEYYTYEKVEVEGQTGQKTILAERTKINGKQTSLNVIQEKVTVNKVDRKVIKGTSKIYPKKGKDFVMPTNGRIGSGFGPRDGYVHKGIDILTAKMTPIYASDDGVVKYSSYNSGGFGNLVIIEHNDGFETYYAHNTNNTVSVGQKVKQGDLIAYVGSTGDSTANHCHFEIRINGTAVNPMNYIK